MIGFCWVGLAFNTWLQEEGFVSWSAYNDMKEAFFFFFKQMMIDDRSVLKGVKYAHVLLYQVLQSHKLCFFQALRHTRKNTIPSALFIQAHIMKGSRAVLHTINVSWVLDMRCPWYCKFFFLEQGNNMKANQQLSGNFG